MNSFEISDDFEASKSGLPPPRYDAFLLFDDADIEIARSVVDRLEKENLKVLFYLKIIHV